MGAIHLSSTVLMHTADADGQGGSFVASTVCLSDYKWFAINSTQMPGAGRLKADRENINIWHWAGR